MMSDQLRWLDLRLRLQVLKQAHARSSDPLSPFKGLVRETMLRISGAIQVLEELTGESQADSPKMAATR
jgi:hypothetical protein